MSMSSQDLDAIFNGTGAVLGAAQTVTSAVASGINDVRTIVDSSRRNAGVFPQQSYPNYSSPMQPVTYGYPYADNGYSYNGYVNYQNNPNMQAGGYPGFTNPNYGALIGNFSQPQQSDPFKSFNPGGAWF